MAATLSKVLALVEIVTFSMDLFWTHVTPDLVTRRVAGDRVAAKSMAGWFLS
jgi:hypothetical protein